MSPFARHALGDVNSVQGGLNALVAAESRRCRNYGSFNDAVAEPPRGKFMKARVRAEEDLIARWPPM